MTEAGHLTTFFDYGIAGGMILLLIYILLQSKKENKETREQQVQLTDKYVSTMMQLVEKQERECAQHIEELKESTKERIDDLKREIDETKRETRQWKEEDKDKVFGMLAKHGSDMLNLTKSINGLINEIKNH
jgi:F0F1-type ATP synthase membrane subunit b/b'